MEVGLDRLLGGDIVILLQHLAAHADGGLEQRRRGGLPPEKGDDALRDGAFALPVAPAGGPDSVSQSSRPAWRKQTRRKDSGGHSSGGQSSTAGRPGRNSAKSGPSAGWVAVQRTADAP